MELVGRQLRSMFERVGEAPLIHHPIHTRRIVPSQDDGAFNPSAFVLLLRRRRRWIIGSVLLLAVLSGVAGIVMPPRYRAVGQLEMLAKDPAQFATAGENGAVGSGNAAAEDALNFNLSLQTQVSVLQSEALATRVIKELNLADTPFFRYDPWIKTEEVNRTQTLPFDESPLKREYVMKKWTKHLRVSAVPGTRIIEVTFTHPDPQVAAQVVNRLLADFVEYNFRVRYDASAKMTGWLDGQLASLKAQVEQSERQMVAAQKDTGLFGSDDTHNIVIGRLEQLNAQAADAQSNRFAKQAIYNLAKSGDPELVATLIGSSGQATSSPSNSAPSLLLALRQQEADISAQLAEVSTKYGSENPKLQQLRNKLDAVRADIKVETERILGRARQEYLAAEAAETAANKALEDQKNIASTMGEKAVLYDIAKHQADSVQQVYQQLLQQTKATAMLAGAQTSDLNILDSAAVPGKPYLPNLPIFLGAGIFVGMLFGVGTAFVRDSLDETLRNPDDVEKITDLPVLGVIPHARELHSVSRKRLSRSKGEKENANALQLPDHQNPVNEALNKALTAPDSLVMEAFRAVRTSILLSRPDNPRKIFMVTSPLPHEGKSFSSLHLASALAQTGKKVLLVDADLRRGTLSRNLAASSTFGLSYLLAEGSSERSYRQISMIPGLTFLAAGVSPPNPAESLGSKKMAQLVDKWRKEYDFVVIDCPPIIPVTDAAVLSPIVDGAILVVRFAVSTQQAIIRSVRALIEVRAECFGVLVNSMDINSADFYSYSGVYGKYGYYKEQPEPGEPVSAGAGVSEMEA
jgi:capsular exopolysaccharide synthesis family protein